MRGTCHRCGGDLPSNDGVTPFCPHCGAPQLYLSNDFLADQQPPPATSDITGARPPPLLRQVDWQTALRCSALVGGVAALLCVVALRVPGISFLSTIWILTASMSTLALYQRRRPLAWMDATIGARIGLTAGLSTIIVVALSMAVAGPIARFGLHSMSGFDADFVQMLVQVKQAAANSSTPAPPEVLRLYDMPEFQVGLILASVATGALVLLVFSAFGGALGGMLRNRRRVQS